MTITDGVIYHVPGLEEYCENDYTTQSNLQIQHNPYQITNDIFNRIRSKNFMIYMETQKTSNSQTNLKKKGAGRIRFPDSTLYYKATVIKTVWPQHKNRNTNQRNRTENPEINPHTYGHPIYDKEGKNTQCRIDSLFNKRSWVLALAAHILKLERYREDQHGP